MVVVHGIVIQEVPDPQNNKTGVNYIQIRDQEQNSLQRNQTNVSLVDHLIQGWNMDSILPQTYNKLIPPIPKIGEPVKVQIALNITQILAVKEDEQVS